MMNRTTNEAATTDIGKEERFNSYLVTFSVTDPHFLAGILGVVGRHTPVICNARRKRLTSHYPSKPVATKKTNNKLLIPTNQYPSRPKETRFEKKLRRYTDLKSYNYM